jgi:DNA-binding IclR family transcriptional regulator
MLKVLDKSLDILELFLFDKTEFTLPELVEMTGYNITTVNRIASKLVNRGYLKKLGRRKGYQLGSKILEFKRVSNNKVNLKNTVYPFLVKLARQIDETITFMTWDGVDSMHIAVIPSVHMLKITPEEWVPTGVALHYTASGKAILANMSDQEFKKYCSSVPMKANTPNTIIDSEDLKNQLLIIRQEGIAYNFEEHNMGENSVASIVKDGEGNVVGSVVVIGPSSRLTRAKMRQFAPEIRRVANDISSELGYRAE